MTIATYYCNDPAAPKPNQPTHIGANVYLEWDGKLLLEQRHDCGEWGLVGGRLRRGEDEAKGAAREVFEETGIRLCESDLTRLGVCGGERIASYRDGSVWKMVIILFHAILRDEPTLRVSSESGALRFFSPDELRTLPTVVTHRDLIENWRTGGYRHGEK